jgi:hypothetical protein
MIRQRAFHIGDKSVPLGQHGFDLTKRAISGFAQDALFHLRGEAEIP